MAELQLDTGVIQWAVDGSRCGANEAFDALAEGRPLLVLMHGYGSFEGDLIQRAPQLPHGFVCASPRAPLVAPAPIVDGYSWFPISLQDESVQPEDAVEYALNAAASISRWLDDLEKALTERGSTPGQVALMGFSQGGVMVTTLMRQNPKRFPAGVNCSGFVAPIDLPGDAELQQLRPPLFWGRDEADPIISNDAIELTARWAPAHTTLTKRLYPGIQHGISLEELDDISAFLRQHVPGL